MLAEIDREREQETTETKAVVQTLQGQIATVEQRMERLLDLYIKGRGIEPEEYQAKKQRLLNEKVEIQQKIRDFEQSGNTCPDPSRMESAQTLHQAQCRLHFERPENPF